jgi:hypothetical protein
VSTKADEADEYRARAEECEREAKMTKDPEVKRSLEELALRCASPQRNHDGRVLGWPRIMRKLPESTTFVSPFVRARGRRMRAVPAAPALRPVAGAELAGRLARRGLAKNDRIDPHVDHLRKPYRARARGAAGCGRCPPHRRCGPSRGSSWRVGWRGGASRRMIESK